MTITRPKPGKLQIKNPDILGHKVTEAEGGKQVVKCEEVAVCVNPLRINFSIAS